MNPREEEWGEDAMLEELKKHVNEPAEAEIRTIVAAADKFAAGAKQQKI